MIRIIAEQIKEREYWLLTDLLNSNKLNLKKNIEAKCMAAMQNFQNPIGMAAFSTSYLFGFMCMALMISLTVKLVIIKDIIKLVQGKIDD